MKKWEQGDKEKGLGTEKFKVQKKREKRGNVGKMERGRKRKRTRKRTRKIKEKCKRRMEKGREKGPNTKIGKRKTRKKMGEK